MPVQGFWLPVLLAVLAVAMVVGRFLLVWLRSRGPRAITCPENRQAAGVSVDQGHAAWTGLKGAPEVRLSSCSRWPERQGCGQECLAQIESSPDGCLVRNILTEWYRGKVCGCCGRSFGEIQWAVQKPALYSADKSVEWSQIPAEQLRGILETAVPVCFACHMANTLVREHPELVVDRGAQGARRIST